MSAATPPPDPGATRRTPGGEAPRRTRSGAATPRPPNRGARRPRVLVHNDQQYWWGPAGLRTRQPFARFACALAEHDVDVTLCGRLEPGAPGGEVAVGPEIGFAGLPAATASAGPRRVLRDAPTTLRRWWHALGAHDVVWLVGPNVWSLPFAVLARVRGVPVVLGVRQDLPEYVRFRHPGDRRALAAATVLDGSFRLLARRRPAIVVGAALAARYRRSPTTLDLRVSLVRRAEVAAAPHAPAHPPARSSAPLRGLSVGRLDREKNPLLLADVLAHAPGWALDVCGDGPLADALVARARALGVADRLTLHGQLDGGALRHRFAAADALVHVSWTEGVPQVVVEAFADGLPVVATDVGGVAAATGDAALVVPPGDAGAVAEALRRLADDPTLAEALAERGLRLARRHTLEAETGRVAALLRAACGLTDRARTPAPAPPAGRRARRPRARA